MSTTFGIPLYPVDDTILLDEEGKLILDSYKRFLSKGARVKIVQDLKLIV